AGANDGSIDEPQIATQAAAMFQVLQQVREDFCKCPVATPASETPVDGLPRTVAFRNVPPGSAGVKAPQDSVEEAVVVFQGSATAAVVHPVWEERGDALPLQPRKFVPAAHRRLPWGYILPPQVGSAVM